ncbi:UNVERIFIED_CONTAM: Cysteine proteinase 3 [Sesamum latifolium]|uniref:Cysteine proteinase 3 n=1 Tax=Sesamum latifolium TaxID=2727402 RepID=A0AAW2U1K2_9LAMI
MSSPTSFPTTYANSSLPFVNLYTLPVPLYNATTSNKLPVTHLAIPGPNLTAGSNTSGALGPSPSTKRNRINISFSTNIVSFCTALQHSAVPRKRRKMMARLLLLLVGVLIAFAGGARAGSQFLAGDNPIRQVVDGLHELEASILRIVGDSRRTLSFARFAHKYGKRYENAEEIRRRFEIFSENLRMIRSHNKKGLSYTMGINEFTDMTWDEFRRHRLGAAQNCSATTRGNHKLTDAPLPESKDWREADIISPVKNQGHCGSCWTFSTTGALEAAYAQAFGKGISLSEQQLVDCAGAFNNFGCHGGLPSQAFEYIKYNGGLETEAAYPYTAKNGVCKFKSENVGVQVLDSVNITLGAEDELKHAVAFVRPVSVAFEVVSGFRAYKSGVYTSTTCGSSPMVSFIHITLYSAGNDRHK